MTEFPYRSVLGLQPQLEALYRGIRASDGTHLAEVGWARGVTEEELLEQLDPLVTLGVVAVIDGIIRVVPPRQALGAALDREAAEITEHVRSLVRFAHVMRQLDGPAPPIADGARLDGEVVQGPVPLDLLVEWITESGGELMFLRPDQWRLPSEPVVAAAFKIALDQGRRARSIYPVQALQQARSVLTDRVAAGEEIRFLPEVPSRMAIVGESRALVPQHPGTGNQRAVVLRDEGLTSTLTLYFEELWDRAVALPVDQGQDGRQDGRRLLLQELAAGARDEHIARVLNIGLRTVRRRIAEMMLELGVETRFQAGVEAVRRGWI